MNEAIRGLVAKYESKGDFTYAEVTDAQIEESQSILQVVLPDQYVQFLKLYGHGGIGGVEILGIGKNGKAVFVNETIKYREFGLQMRYIMIENCDEWVYCIDSSDESVVSWTQEEVRPVFRDFDAFLWDRFSDAAENL